MKGVRRGTALPHSRREHGTIRLGIVLACLALSACVSRSPNAIGDPYQGAVVIMRSSCGSCHVIPGIPLANGQVGPPLTAFGQRMIIAGTLPNSLPNLVLWLRHPQQVAPRNSMPETGLTDRQARDVAAYLYQLR